MVESPTDSTLGRSACTECQRRKQKCNREWPCNHCQKRKVADKCRFAPRRLSPDQPGGQQDTGRKRQLSQEDQSDSTGTSPWEDGDSGFEALGYTASHLFSAFDAPERRNKTAIRKQEQYYLDVGSCPQLARALQLLPPRPYTDSLVQNFVDNVNYHYYIIYPPSFLDAYRHWWAARSENGPLSLQWTCLLFMVCACSAQYTDIELQRKLEGDLGETTQKLTEKYHNAARELHSVIPVGNNHILNVQSLLHSCYWYKSEARFVECWHVLSTAIREAQELDIHREAVAGPLSEFEQEMRRRAWCVLDTWDWQISALLSRPMLIDRTDCDVGLPSLNMEGYWPSPLLHMKLQSELITKLASRFGVPKNVVAAADVREYQRIVEAWMKTFPPTYDFDDPDVSNDVARPWVVLHRHYLRTMSLSMLLDPIRAYLAKSLTAGSPPDELQIRSDGIDYSLKLMSVLYGFFDHVYPRDAKFHFVLFSIFDTAAVLCSALMHDGDASIPRRDDIFHAIDSAVDLLRRLSNVTKTAKTSYEILSRVIQRVSRASVAPSFRAQRENGQQRKKSRVEQPTMTPLAAGQNQSQMTSSSDQSSVRSYVTYGSVSSDVTPSAYTQPLHAVSQGNPLSAPHLQMGYPATSSGGLGMNGSVCMTTSSVNPLSMGSFASPEPYPDLTPPMDDIYQPLEFGEITQQDLGDLATLWNYESLNLNFIDPQGPL